jgi:hypothetical protein
LDYFKRVRSNLSVLPDTIIKQTNERENLNG